MRIQAYTAFTGTLAISVETLRAEAAGSVLFTAATIHEDFAATVRAIMEEHIHCGEASVFFPDAQRISTYFPTAGTPARPLFALRQLKPSGSPRGIDKDYMLEILSLRYTFNLVLLPAAFIASAAIRSAKERHLEFAVRQLFQANGVPDSYIPGDQTLRNKHQSEVSIICEMGEATERQGVDVPAP